MKKYYVLSALAGLLLFLPLSAEELLTAETYASYYGEAFDGKPTSSGEIFDMNAYTAAHKSLPFGTFLEVTNLENGKKVIVRVNDRGPFVANRDIDLSKAAAESLGMLNRGITRVSIKRVDSLEHAALVAANDTYSEASVRSTANTQTPTTTQPEAVPVQQPEKKQPMQTQQQYAAPQQTTAPQARTMEQIALQEAKKEPVSAAAPTKQDAAGETERVYIPTTAEETPGVLWRIQLGAFTREENALRLVTGLRKAGLEPAYERTDTSVRVVLPGIRPSDLEKVKKALSDHAFTDYIIRQESW